MASCSSSWSAGHFMLRASTRMTWCQSLWLTLPSTKQKVQHYAHPFSLGVALILPPAFCGDLNRACAEYETHRCLCYLPGNKMGIDLVREMFANATKWKLNTVRIYAHSTDPDHPFMVRSHSILEKRFCNL